MHMYVIAAYSGHVLLARGIIRGHQRYSSSLARTGLFGATVSHISDARDV